MMKLKKNEDYLAESCNKRNERTNAESPNGTQGNAVNANESGEEKRRVRRPLYTRRRVLIKAAFG